MKKKANTNIVIILVLLAAFVGAVYLVRPASLFPTNLQTIAPDIELTKVAYYPGEMMQGTGQIVFSPYGWRNTILYGEAFAYMDGHPLPSLASWGRCFDGGTGYQQVKLWSGNITADTTGLAVGEHEYCVKVYNAQWNDCSSNFAVYQIRDIWNACADKTACSTVKLYGTDCVKFNIIEKQATIPAVIKQTGGFWQKLWEWLTSIF